MTQQQQNEPEDNKTLYIGLGILTAAIAYLGIFKQKDTINAVAKVASDASLVHGQGKLNDYFNKEGVVKDQ